jgi:DnaJ homolog subfamily C member 13
MCVCVQVTGDTKLWAQGMDGWRRPHENAQLKWTLLVKDTGVLNESEAAALGLGMLVRMCEMYPSRHRDGAIIRPLPKIKRCVSPSSPRTYT